MYYRLSNDIKILLIRFFQTLFTLYSEGKIEFQDGRSKVAFTTSPKCMDLDTYDFRYYPCVLVGLSPGTFKDTHFNKYRGTETINGVPEKIYGGTTAMTLNFQVYATNENDRNNLADLVCTYLAKRDTKETFEQKYGIRFMMPTFTGDNAEDDPVTNVRRFYTNISLLVEADFEDNANIVAPSGDIGLTLQNVISYIGDADADGEIEDLMDNTIP
mgnify:CR=1 FL=1